MGGQPREASKAGVAGKPRVLEGALRLEQLKEAREAQGWQGWQGSREAHEG